MKAAEDIGLKQRPEKPRKVAVPGIADGIRQRARRERTIAAIPNGCDLALFTPEKRRKPLDLAGIATGDFMTGFTGAHGIANGLDAVLDAAAELQRRKRTDIKVVFIGDGNQKDRLAARAKAEGLRNCLFFPPVKKTEIARITASFDCGLQILADIPAFYRGTSPNKFSTTFRPAFRCLTTIQAGWQNWSKGTGVVSWFRHEILSRSPMPSASWLIIRSGVGSWATQRADWLKHDSDVTNWPGNLSGSWRTLQQWRPKKFRRIFACYLHCYPSLTKCARTRDSRRLRRWRPRCVGGRILDLSRSISLNLPCASKRNLGSMFLPMASSRLWVR